MKNLFKMGLMIVLIISSCASIYVAVDYDKGFNFSKLKKYKWIKQKKTDDFQSIYKSDINRKRFATSVESALLKKGFERVDNSDYDFSVVYHLRFDKKLDVTAYGYKYYPATGYSERYVQTKVYQQGSIVIDIIDAAEKQLIWRGAAEGVLHETDDPEKTIEESVKAILKDFPPSL